ncbi:MAG: DUF421 domain-containing protein [Tatlockia sp.]|nr:DUF421 domain-containing protein [Tatlockia sp.]
MNVFSAFHIDYYTRAIVVTFYALFLFRISDNRLLSQLAAYDLFVFIILGAILGTAVIDKELFIPSLICCFIITLLHRFLGFISTFKVTQKYFRGKRITLYENNKWQHNHLDSCSLQKDDIYQELRCSLGIDSMDTIEKIIMEKNGKISFLKQANDRDNKIEKRDNCITSSHRP